MQIDERLEGSRVVRQKQPSSKEALVLLIQFERQRFLKRSIWSGSLCTLRKSRIAVSFKALNPEIKQRRVDKT